AGQRGGDRGRARHVAGPRPRPPGVDGLRLRPRQGAPSHRSDDHVRPHRAGHPARRSAVQVRSVCRRASAVQRGPAAARTRRPARVAAAAAATLGPVRPVRATPGSPSAANSGPGAVRPVLHGIDLESATIPDLQKAMDRGRLSSVELTRFSLRRIRVLDKKVNAVLAVNPDALEIAAASDQQRRRHGARSPLEGIPVLLKDNIETRDGQPTTAGSLALVGSPVGEDAFLVRRLRLAGAVVVGKANLSEWANFRSTDSSSGWSGVGGQTNNPYVLDRNPCGSSSGSGAGVAANLATVAIGTETDGSIVCPSGHNGVVGISAEQDTAGPIAKHVVDAALVLEVIRGIDPTDAATEDAEPFLEVDL